MAVISSTETDRWKTGNKLQKEREAQLELSGSVRLWVSYDSVTRKNRTALQPVAVAVFNFLIILKPVTTDPGRVQYTSTFIYYNY